jgi:hypothetical protein
MTSEWEHHVDFSTNAFNQTANFGQVAGTVEGAVSGANDADPRLFACCNARLNGLRAGILRRPYSLQSQYMARLAHCHRSSSMVRGKKRLNVGAFWRDAATDHFSACSPRPPPRQASRDATLHAARFMEPSSAFATQLLFCQASDHNGQLVRWQAVGVMQHRSHRQMLSAHRAVDHNLRAFDGGEHIHRTLNNRLRGRGPK